MLDHSQWLQETIALLEGNRTLPGDIRVEIDVAPPLKSKKLRELEATSRLPIPNSLKRFWMEASRHADCRYWWDTPAQFHSQKQVVFPHWSLSHIWGGPEFLPAKDICSSTHGLVSWADAFDESEPQDARIWRHSLPLIPVGNGDFAGLYVRDSSDDPPVVYQCHEGGGGSQVIAPSLDTFLTRWATVGYIGVEFLNHFCRHGRHEFEPAACPVE